VLWRFFFYWLDYKKGIYQEGCKKSYWNKLLRLIFEQDDENKQLFLDKFLMKKEKEETTSLEDYIIYKKTHLLYDWIEGKKSVKAIEEEYGLYRGCIYRLAEGFSWLANSLSAIAECMNLEKKINKDLGKIKMLSNRLIEGIQEEGINLTLLYIPGLSRYNIRKLVGAGYEDENSLRDVSEDELGKLIPRRLVQRILESVKEDNNHQTVSKEKWIVKAEKLKVSKKVPEEDEISISERQLESDLSAASLGPLLEISKHRPDRIIFMGKKIRVTATEFALICILARNNARVLSYDELVYELWGDNENAIYRRVNYHFFNIKKMILKTIGENKTNIERIKNILVVVPGRGIMLNLEDQELIINQHDANVSVS